MSIKYSMSDRDRWDRALGDVTADYFALPPKVRGQVAEAARAIRGMRRELHRFAEDVDGAAICASCGGECCLSGKYHVTVADILVFLAEGEPLFTPHFDRDVCPYLDGHGCMMEPSLRPFPCITFNCERIEGFWEPERIETFYRIERQLRTLYGELERLFARRAGSARRIALLGYDPDQERCTDGDNDQ